MDNIRVFCRFRPFNDIEVKNNGRNCVEFHEDSHTVVVRDIECQASDIKCSFDHVFKKDSSQKDVYDRTARPLIEDAINGYNCTIFAYGQTGSGKSHTMMGPHDDTSITSNQRGIIPRVIDHIFALMETSGEDIEFTIKIGYIEIYLERVNDLLNPDATNLRIRQDPVRGVYIDGVTELYTASREEMLELVAKGNALKAVSCTKMNKDSSRSHSVLVITVTQRDIVSCVEKRGRLYLVDLAGSEMVNKTQATGAVLKEAMMINKSLSALGNVIKALSEEKPHVPYRDSKLTRILQDSLGGNSKTLLIVTASSNSYNITETLSTLRFGIRAKSIKNKPHVNQEKTADDYKKLLARAQKKLENQNVRVQQLELALGQAKDRADDLEKLNNAFKDQETATSDDLALQLLDMNAMVLKLESEKETAQCRLSSREYEITALVKKVEEKKIEVTQLQGTIIEKGEAIDELSIKLAQEELKSNELAFQLKERTLVQAQQNYEPAGESFVTTPTEASPLAFEPKQVDLEQDSSIMQEKSNAVEMFDSRIRINAENEDWAKLREHLELELFHLKAETQRALSPDTFDMVQHSKKLQIDLHQSQKLMHETTNELRKVKERCNLLESRLSNREEHLGYLAHSVSEFQLMFKDQVLTHQERVKDLTNDLEYYKTLWEYASTNDTLCGKSIPSVIDEYNVSDGSDPGEIHPKPGLISTGSDRMRKALNRLVEPRKSPTNKKSGKIIKPIQGGGASRSQKEEPKVDQLPLSPLSRLIRRATSAMSDARDLSRK